MNIDPDATINVATVCGNEVSIYGDVPKEGGRRPLLRRFRLQHHGAAVLYAQEHDEAERSARARRQAVGR